MNFFRLPFFVLACFLISGCVGFKQNRLGPAAEFAAHHEDMLKPRIALSFQAETKMFAQKKYGERSTDILRKEFVDVLAKSGLFGEIGRDDPESAIRMDVTILDHGNPAALIPALVTGYSLYTVPSWITQKFTLTATVTKGDGSKHEYALDDSCVMVQWLPMIILTPFKHPIPMAIQTRRNMYKHLLNQMIKDHAI